MSQMLAKTCSLGFRYLEAHRLGFYIENAKARLLERSALVCDGSGIIIAGGGRYEDWAYQLVKHIRGLNRSVPIEVWCLNRHEVKNVQAFLDLDSFVVPATDHLTAHPMRRMGGWGLKGFACLHSRLRNILFLDADCFPTAAGLELLEHDDFLNVGALFFNDVKYCHGSDEIYHAANLKSPREMGSAEWETGQFLIDKARCWHALALACWMSEHSEVFWSPKLHGDKGSTEIAFRATKTLHMLSSDSTWHDWGIAHRYEGQMRFRHLLGVKRGEAKLPSLV